MSIATKLLASAALMVMLSGVSAYAADPAATQTPAPATGQATTPTPAQQMHKQRTHAARQHKTNTTQPAKPKAQQHSALDKSADALNACQLQADKQACMDRVVHPQG